jgi:hypothetical protein
VPPAQARAIVRAIEIELAGAADTLATKSDLLLLRNELSSEVGGVRQTLELRIEALRGELRAEIHASASSTQRQMYAALLGQMAVLLGIVYFFVMHLPR